MPGVRSGTMPARKQRPNQFPWQKQWLLWLLLWRRFYSGKS